MSDIFTLRIKLGNAEMSEAHHITAALRHVADEVEAGAYDTHTIRDANGNTVGEWALQHDSPCNCAAALTYGVGGHAASCPARD